MENNTNKQTVNRVDSLCGVLVKKNLEIVKDNENKNVIRGSLTIRTKDGSEHEINIYTKEMTKQGTVSKLYSGLTTVLNEYKSLETHPEQADIISVGGANFSVNDYVSKKDGSLKMSNKISGKFVSRTDATKMEATPESATFVVQGIISSMKDEVYNDVPTGNILVTMDTLGYEGKTLIPVKLVIMKEMAEAFQSAGFYEGCVTTLNGKVVNKVVQEAGSQQVAFGQAQTFSKTVRRNEVLGGTTPITIYDLGITDEEYNKLKAERKMKLDSKLAENQPSGFGVTNNQGFTASTVQSTSTQATQFNPFATR